MPWPLSGKHYGKCNLTSNSPSLIFLSSPGFFSDIAWSVPCPTGTVTHTTLTHTSILFHPNLHLQGGTVNPVFSPLSEESKRRLIKSNSYESHLSFSISCITAFNKACFMVQPSSEVLTKALLKVLVLHAP